MPETFVGGEEAAARFVASVAWPLERQENRDSWAPRLLAEPNMLALEAKRARERLDAAIALCQAAVNRPPGRCRTCKGTGWVPSGCVCHDDPCPTCKPKRVLPPGQPATPPAQPTAGDGAS